MFLKEMSLVEEFINGKIIKDILIVQINQINLTNRFIYEPSKIKNSIDVLLENRRTPIRICQKCIALFKINMFIFF